MEAILMPLLGGVLIGFSSSTMLGGLGRITGISGIVSTTLAKPSRENLWRYTFLGGLLIGGFLMEYFMPTLFEYEIKESRTTIILAGLLVGFGTNLGGGCTSGHGVCGLSRMAKRSFAATVIFIGFGMLTVFFRGLI